MNILGGIDFLRMNIAGGIDFSRMNIAGGIDFSRMNIAGGIDFLRMNIAGGIDFSGMNIAGGFIQALSFASIGIVTFTGFHILAKNYFVAGEVVQTVHLAFTFKSRCDIFNETKSGVRGRKRAVFLITFMYLLTVKSCTVIKRSNFNKSKILSHKMMPSQ